MPSSLRNLIRTWSGQTAVSTEQGQTARAASPCRNPHRPAFLGLGDEAIDGLPLLLDQLHHFGLELLEFVLVAFGRGPRLPTGSASSIHAVDLVDDGIMVLALHGGPDAWPCCPGGNRSRIRCSFRRQCRTGRQRGAVRSCHAGRCNPRSTVKLENRPHPLAVTASQVIVHGYEMDPASGQGIEEHGKCGHGVFPSPVCISATLPRCRATPPMSWTS